jgi:hypothetical protein
MNALDRYLENVKEEHKDQLIRFYMSCKNIYELRDTWAFISHNVDEFNKFYIITPEQIKKGSIEIKKDEVLKNGE